jgi:NIPSNAP
MGDSGTCCPVVELRQYTLHPGTRETLIGLFEREFIETQEAVGIRVIAQFRDLDRPDMFIWLRGFADMEARATALSAFYDGPVWAKHKEAANSTMIDSDNVLLLHPAEHGAAFAALERGERGTAESGAGLIIASIYPVDPDRADVVRDLLLRELEPLAATHGATPLALLETEPRVNTFPRLPVREDAYVFVRFEGFESLAAHKQHLAQLAREPAWTQSIDPALAESLTGHAERLRLLPTARSRKLL